MKMDIDTTYPFLHWQWIISLYTVIILFAFFLCLVLNVSRMLILDYPFRILRFFYLWDPLLKTKSRGSGYLAFLLQGKIFNYKKGHLMTIHVQLGYIMFVV